MRKDRNYRLMLSYEEANAVEKGVQLLKAVERGLEEVGPERKAFLSRLIRRIENVATWFPKDDL